MNDRLTAQIPHRDNIHLTPINVYSLTIQCSVVEKELFNERFGECIVKAKGDSVFLLGDFNACTGKEWQLWLSVIEKHGTGKVNLNGLMLLEFCTL